MQTFVSANEQLVKVREEAEGLQIGIVSKMHRRKKLIYTVFSLLATSKYTVGRRFGCGFIKSVRKSAEKLIDLTDEKFEKRFKGSQERDAAWKFLSSIAQMFDEVAVEEDNEDNTNPDHTKDATVPESEKGSPDRPAFDDNAVLDVIRKEQTTNDNLLLDDDATRMTNDRLEQPVKDKKVKEDDAVSNKLGYNRFMVEDVWNVGSARLEKDNIGAKRQHAIERLKRKTSMTAAMNAAEALTNATELILKPDINVEVSPWNNYVTSSFSDLY